MNLREVFGKDKTVDIPQMFTDFLPVAMKVLNIDKLPKIHLRKTIDDEEQPTFGRYINDIVTIELSIANRHPVDILRTLAHELVHFRQHGQGQLGAHSGDTGSSEENEANEIAGIIMRNFNKMHPDYLRTRPVVLEHILAEKWSKKYKSSINCSNPKGFSQRAHCAGRKKNEGVAEGSLNELDTSTLKNYREKAGKEVKDLDRKKQELGQLSDKDFFKKQDRLMGITGASKRIDKRGITGVAEGKVKLYTDPDYFGAEVDDSGFDSLPVVNIPANQLVGFEPDDKMDQPKSKANVKKIVAGLKKGDKLPPILVRKYKKGYQVLDGHHRFWAYKLLKIKLIPAQIVPAKDIEEISKQDVAENFADGKNPGRKGLAKRSGVNCKASISTLRNVAKNSSGEKQRMAHWCANMKSGRKK